MADINSNDPGADFNRLVDDLASSLNTQGTMSFKARVQKWTGLHRPLFLLSLPPNVGRLWSRFVEKIMAQEGPGDKP